MYDAYLDPYCYRDSAVLRNKAGIRDQAVLDEFETAMTFVRASEPLPAGRLSVSHYKAVHHHFFQDVYSWAGKFRTIGVTKGDSTFCYPENIPQEMARLFKWLGERRFLIDLDRGDFAEKAAHFLAELNAIHPFREGNGRTQNAFLALLGANAGYPVDVTKLTPKATIDAMIRSFHGDEEPLAALIELLTQWHSFRQVSALAQPFREDPFRRGCHRPMAFFGGFFGGGLHRRETRRPTGAVRWRGDAYLLHISGEQPTHVKGGAFGL